MPTGKRPTGTPFRPGAKGSESRKTPARFRLAIDTSPRTPSTTSASVVNPGAVPPSTAVTLPWPGVTLPPGPHSEVGTAFTSVDWSALVMIVVQPNAMSTGRSRCCSSVSLS